MPIAGLLNTAATLAAPASWNGVGEATFVTPATAVRVRIEPSRKEVQLSPAEKVRADAVAFIKIGVTVQPGYRLTVAGRKYRVLTVARMEDVTGTGSHQELLLREER